jgi:hypothetical protein
MEILRDSLIADLVHPKSKTMLNSSVAGGNLKLTAINMINALGIGIIPRYARHGGNSVEVYNTAEVAQFVQQLLIQCSHLNFICLRFAVWSRCFLTIRRYMENVAYFTTGHCYPEKEHGILSGKFS